jgi:mannose-6-phosphate isomerase-like protein (cupin superfamily)
MRHVSDSIDDPSLCVVRIAQGERIAGNLADLLNPVDPRTFHQYRLPANTNVELHMHDFDEYWWFVEGRPTITLRSANGVTRQFELGPGDLVACVRGVEHTLRADHELVYYQYSSVLIGDERPGHLIRQA